MIKKLCLDLGAHKSEIWMSDRPLKSVQDLSNLEKCRKAYLIGDRSVSKITLELEGALKKCGWTVNTRQLAVSESLKDFKNLYPLYGWLAQNGADRQSMVFAIGGGVIGDVIGFVAGTYHRGIKWVGVPTTLLSQVDSSVGGKTGMNHSDGKNLVGVFHQPSYVLCNPTDLKTLSNRDFISGLGEVIKYSLVFDSLFFTFLQKNWSSILKRSPDLIAKIVYRCLQWKIKAVQNDERDLHGSREVLNFGHTFAHSLEAETRYRFFRHGEAVIWGMRFALYLSHSRGILAEKQWSKIDHFLAQIPIPALPKSLKPEALVSWMKKDKKNVQGKIKFVLLEKMGQTRVRCEVPNDEVVAAIHWVRGLPDGITHRIAGKITGKIKR